MKTDPLEERIRKTPLRPLPADWRETILAGAGARQPAGATTGRGADTAWWREWLWPHPRAWAAVAAAWMLILLLHLAGPGWPGPPAFPRAVPPAERLQAFLDHRKELSNLLEGRAEPPPEPSSPALPPGPRSEAPRRIAYA